MAQKRTAKPKAKPKPVPKPVMAHVKMPLPIPPEFHAEELPAVKIVPLEPTVHVEPLPAPVEFTGHLSISETFWTGTRLVGLLPDAGCALPAFLKSGQRVKVQIMPVETPAVTEPEPCSEPKHHEDHGSAG